MTAEQLPLLPDPVRDTSRAALESIAPRVERIQGLALLAVREAGDPGLTADEVAQRLKLSVLAVRPRITELNKLGQIKATDRRRRNASGRLATVWVAA